jgi:hypothetical protein
VPFSAAVPKPSFTPQTFAENLLAMIVFGLIIAFFAHRGDGARSVGLIATCRSSAKNTRRSARERLRYSEPQGMRDAPRAGLTAA